MCDMTTPGWKPNQKNMEEQVNFLTSLKPPPDVLQEDGTLTLPVRQEDGYHVT